MIKGSIDSIINDNTWLMSDHHYGHKHIAGYEPTRNCWRDLGYKSHDDMLICKHNAKVSVGESVLFLGDFSWVNPVEYSGYLKGDLHLILGNHDRKSDQPYRDFTHIFKGYNIAMNDLLYHSEAIDPLLSCLFVPYEDKILAFSHYAIGYDDPYDHQASGLIQIRKDHILKRLHEFNGNGKDVINIHGHLHSHRAVDNTIKGLTYRNVSAECTNFEPVRLGDVIKGKY